ncbi:MAG: damage-inducible protein CinA [Sphingomonas sp.]|nr:damage-inducible protein CinA [Sphingomonas sp.]
MTETLSPAIPDSIERAAHDVLEAACDKDLTLAVAESCTGGLLASLLTDVEGVSHAFERGFVVYSKAAKCELLNIAPEQIDRCGAVSAAVAKAMADGALAASGADIALAVTGFAGPGGPEDESGLVYLGCARSGAETVTREEHYGDIGRGPTRIRAIGTALEMLRQAIG